jgi:hypothetical protein
LIYPKLNSSRKSLVIKFRRSAGQIDGVQWILHWRCYILIFFTFFCISFQVTIIGVHSPKYEHEKNKSNVRHAIEEQLLPFPIVNDNGLQVWKHIGCQIWPTVLVFGPDLLPIYIFEGENHVQHLETFLVPVLAHYKSSVRASPTNSSSIKNSLEDMVTGSDLFEWEFKVIILFYSSKINDIYLSKSSMCHFQWSIMYFICWFKSIDSMWNWWESCCKCSYL